MPAELDQKKGKKDFVMRELNHCMPVSCGARAACTRSKRFSLSRAALAGMGYLKGGSSLRHDNGRDRQRGRGLERVEED